MSEAVDRLTNESLIKKKMKPTFLKDFFAVVKIGIVNSNLLTTFTGLWLAIYFNGLVFFDHIDTIIFTVIGSSFIIAGSCAVNNYFDRDIDHLMERTSERPTVTGVYKENNVLALAIGLLIIGFLVLSFTTITATLIGLVGTVTYVFLYTMWTKRKYTLNTVVGSISGATPPLIGWAAIDSDLHVVAWVLFFILFIWQIPHFLALAMKRVEEYRRAGVPMLPVVYGFDMTKRQILIWILFLLPFPFLMYGLGYGFIILATILNVGWLVLGIRGFRSQDATKWSVKMFVYSLNYLTILFVSMVLFTLF
ncbi:MAG: heme o synthase [Bacillaceae bacterium]